jgi:hypothetical protein
LRFEALPDPVVLPGNTVAPATAFLRVQLLDAQSQVLEEWPLADLPMDAGSPGSVWLAVSQGGTCAAVRFSLSLLEPGLPMDQLVRLTVDDLALE